MTTPLRTLGVKPRSCGQRGPGFGGLGAVRGGYLLKRQPVSLVARLGGGRVNVGGDAGALPAGAADRVDGGGDGDGRLQVRVDAEFLAGVAAAAGGFTDDDGPAELLQVVRQLFAAGEGGRAGQRVNGLGLAEAAAGHIRQRPGLPGLAVLAFLQAGELDRVVVPEVADEEGRHGGLTAQALAHVDDEGLGGGNQAHRGGDQLAADDGGEQDGRQVQVADVARQALHAGDAAAGLLRPPGHGGVLVRVVPWFTVADGLVVVEQPQVLVAVDRLQVGGDRRRELAFIGRVPALGQPGGQHLRHLCTDAGVDVAGFDQGLNLVDDPGHLVLVHAAREAGPCLSVKSS